MMNEVINIKPEIGELPSHFADRLGIKYANSVVAKHKKENGQFFTPLSIAQLMASYSSVQLDVFRILDPGCGTGVLSCSLIEFLSSKNSPITKVELIVYETDLKLKPIIESVFIYLKEWLLSKNIELLFEIRSVDFILDFANIKQVTNEKGFDIIISNPPYFKLSKDDARATATKDIVSGQTNIYSLFMAVASKMLNENGELLFITPRSFASGNYFRSFRALFFSQVQLDKIHLFNSRKDTFSRDSVLQETVIIKAIKRDIDFSHNVVVSSSIGISDIAIPNIKLFAFTDLIDLDSKEKILHLPINDKEEHILSLVSSWKDTLSEFNIQISTGPVVSFRSLDYIQDFYTNGTVFLTPLFWLHNVNKMSLEWPVSSKNKGQYIKVEKASLSRLIPNKNYILLRRFSTKDDKSRLIAAPYFCNYFKADYIGVENKVNYIYRKNGHLERSEVAGLCALLNSSLFDAYFQIFNGNVNVSATELREMRFPSLTEIKEIGNQIILSNDFSMDNVNRIVTTIFRMDVLMQ